MTTVSARVTATLKTYVDFAKAAPEIRHWLKCSAAAEVTDIPEDFLGVNLATGADSAIDDYLIEQLQTLGIQQVRMDFSYDSLNGPAQRFLERLLAEDFNVLLEIFPPLQQAKILHKNPSAQSQWEAFLDQVFNQYGDKVEVFEIGSTPNRGRWSGFSFLSYQRAWQLAYAVAEGRNLSLAGPNVSDFEPLYNAGFLTSMKRLAGPPAIHTDNLFVERVVEPEAYDHRVLGRWLMHALQLNLIKKANILQKIGSDNGASATWCTYKCWTSKRLARRSAWPQQKQVDYLLRYLVLAASSGALGRVYWGPLVCSRDGLISDQQSDYPQIDQVSYYQCIRGELKDFTITPAFHALAYASQLLPGAHCTALIHQPYGLSIFHLSSTHTRTSMVCWCRDGMSWPLLDLFTEQELAGATFSDATGQQLSRPAVVCEQPLVIEFGNSTVLPDTVAARRFRAQSTIHLSSPDHQSIADFQGSWIGAAMLRKEQQTSDLESLASLRPAAITLLPETAVLRDARNRIWNVKDPRGICDQVSVKLNRVVGLKRLSYRFRPSKGRRHWNNACEMLRRGVNTPLPVAFYEQRESPGIQDSWYLCEFVPDTFSAREVYASLRDGAPEYRGLARPEWLKVLAEFVCDMHNKQIVHRDLSAGNLLIRLSENGTPLPYLIDIGRTWLGNGSGLGPGRRLQDLIRICYKLDWADRRAFVGYYCAFMGEAFPSWWPLPFHYYDYKQKFKKSIKNRKGKTPKNG